MLIAASLAPPTALAASTSTLKASAVDFGFAVTDLTPHDGIDAGFSFDGRAFTVAINSAIRSPNNVSVINQFESSDRFGSAFRLKDQVDEFKMVTKTGPTSVSTFGAASKPLTSIFSAVASTTAFDLSVAPNTKVTFWALASASRSLAPECVGGVCVGSVTAALSLRNGLLFTQDLVSVDFGKSSDSPKDSVSRKIMLSISAGAKRLENLILGLQAIISMGPRSVICQP